MGLVYLSGKAYTTPCRLLGHHADLFMQRDAHVRTLRATFGMYLEPVEPSSAAVNYEKHITTEAAAQGSVPRSKFGM